MQKLDSKQKELLSNIYDMLISNDEETVKLAINILLNEPLLSNLYNLLYYAENVYIGNEPHPIFSVSTLCYSFLKYEIRKLLQEHKL